MSLLDSAEGGGSCRTYVNQSPIPKSVRVASCGEGHQQSFTER